MPICFPCHLDPPGAVDKAARFAAGNDIREDAGDRYGPPVVVDVHPIPRGPYQWFIKSSCSKLISSPK